MGPLTGIRCGREACSAMTVHPWSHSVTEAQTCRPTLWVFPRTVVFVHAAFLPVSPEQRWYADPNRHGSCFLDGAFVTETILHIRIWQEGTFDRAVFVQISWTLSAWKLTYGQLYISRIEETFPNCQFPKMFLATLQRLKANLDTF